MTYMEGGTNPTQPIQIYKANKEHILREVVHHELQNPTSCCKSPLPLQQQQMGTGTVRGDKSVMVTINSKGQRLCRTIKHSLGVLAISEPENGFMEPQFPMRFVSVIVHPLLII